MEPPLSDWGGRELWGLRRAGQENEGPKQSAVGESRTERAGRLGGVGPVRGRRSWESE